MDISIIQNELCQADVLLLWNELLVSFCVHLLFLLISEKFSVLQSQFCSTMTLV